MKLQCPVPKILLPLDGSEHSKKAVKFAGCLGASFGKELSGITLLHVMAGGYLSRHLSYIDLRAEELIRSEAFKKLKEQHIKEHIMPFMDEGEKVLRDSGMEVGIEKRVVDGDPASEIIRIANDGKFSTIIMARRGLSEIEGIFLGSVTNKVVHGAVRQTVYIAGDKIPCPAFKILIPVDGSPYSIKGVEHAACLSRAFKDSFSRITLLNVINLALYEKRIVEGVTPENDAKRILDEARTVFLNAGVTEGIIETKVRIGGPAEEIIKEAEDDDYNLIVMGRRGRSTIKDLLLGGVSSTVLQRCQNPTIAIISNA